MYDYKRPYCTHKYKYIWMDFFLDLLDFREWMSKKNISAGTIDKYKNFFKKHEHRN